ncbi:phospholipase D/Transphosphatidylase [Deinococcus proteolyticus MRP]|uniref:phospholipase D n=1 Tax=Deinococcus proteolyticus (strain ATCC 35074 / DSM 20540 / JCM 6276 / NBRC 101906 / NCIMB 13154 / VKM Ac-1939 / CCM 2703 / MRP) TaxID=693977 RepID=F0RKX7_DEIPM|nr:phospholipase D/Transphosphatidylase [Deinococcus proteolyticus MRP]
MLKVEPGWHTELHWGGQLPVRCCPIRVRWPLYTGNTVSVPLSLRFLLACCGFAAGFPAAAQTLEVPLYLSRPVQPQLEAGAYHCEPPQQPAVRAAWEALRAYGETDFSCGNAFVDYLETSSPLPGAGPDAFAKANRQILAARAEVLLTNMDFYPEAGAPTWALLDTLAELYRRVQAGGRAAYPQGMNVRLHLGGYPLPQRPPRWIAAELAEGLLARGVPLQDAALGWDLRLAHYRLTPYSHIKMQVVDGREVTAAGYGYGRNWLPASAAVPQGGGVSDLGLTLRGPVAQNAAAAFADLWSLSDELSCPPEVQPGGVRERCRWRPAGPLTRSALARGVVPAGDSAALLLYRRSGYLQADAAQLALLGAARREIDLLHTSLSTQLNCVALQPWADICRGMPLPPYFTALLDAMERGVRVRVLTMGGKAEGLQNRTGVLILRRAAQERGLEHLLDVRATTYSMHSKTLLVDGEAALTGSINLHFSSWGHAGLAEAALLTDDPAAAAWLQQRFDSDWQKRSRPFDSNLTAADLK